MLWRHQKTRCWYRWNLSLILLPAAYMCDWVSQRESWLKRVSACSNLKPISIPLQQWNEVVLFSTCLRCCSLIDTTLWSAGRSASWYKVKPVSFLQTLIPWCNHPWTAGASLWDFSTKVASFLPNSEPTFIPYNNHLSNNYSKTTTKTKSLQLTDNAPFHFLKE